VGLSLLVHALDEWVVAKLAQGLNLVSWRWCHVLARSRTGRRLRRSLSALEMRRGRRRSGESPTGERRKNRQSPSPSEESFFDDGAAGDAAGEVEGNPLHT